MNIIYDSKQKVLWDQVVIIILVFAMAAAAAYAITTSNQTYPSRVSNDNVVTGNNTQKNTPENEPGSQPLSNNSTSQLQQGTPLEQGSTNSPQNAGTSSPMDPNYCGRNDMMCANPY